MKNVLVGRKAESEQLQAYIASEKSEFVALYGRRRVGKTFLIRSVVGEKASFSITGMANVTIKEQLANFWFEMKKANPEILPPKSWLEAFGQLENVLSSVRKKQKIVVIDELPWFDTPRSNFISALEHFWNHWASARNDIKLIVCGSATSWMINNIIKNRGGLHNRVTHKMLIEPFSLKQCKEYFDAYKFGYGNVEVVNSYMVFGGVPFYFSKMKPSLSVAQNIDNLLFASNGELQDEFDELYNSLFKHSADYKLIIAKLAGKMKGLSREEILKETKLNNNAHFTEMLDNLEKCNFIRCYVPITNKAREFLYQLVDPFSCFYFHYMLFNKYKDEHFWTSNLNSPLFHAWSGYAFEILCLNHVSQIKHALGISGIQSNACCWSCKDTQGGSQIDLLIDRSDNVISVCEMKYSRNEYEITKADAENFMNKIDKLMLHTKTKKSIRFTMVTLSGLKQNKYSYIAQNQVDIKNIMNL